MGLFNSNLQYQGNQGNILPYAEVNGGANAGDFATYTSLGIAAFSNYLQLSVSGNGTLNANPADIVKVVVFGNSSVTLQTASNLSLGALLFDNTSASSTLVVNIPNTLTVGWWPADVPEDAGTRGVASMSWGAKSTCPAKGSSSTTTRGRC